MCHVSGKAIPDTIHGSALEDELHEAQDSDLLAQAPLVRNQRRLRIESRRMPGTPQL